ncbi:acyl-ACP--UDP-N-acetylglucosamine O-acyltransferase [Coralloluteibacterium stylophorae]|uniref:Acyl-[acyl-carrier-protein]--UDP-N-acetylglucosamine O-acyltransferase n=1 Tax=Coralloluteibacterium stylophorae TaxID=1776034 RepID=A0AAP2C9B3_9GAMM|nr:acyl-ACP--UDP-N-acetylglucosamine O-acyltransferase [Coralloluteibacterium stylophorae]MBS7456342.1 acyl-ACP--UDP-N-acetylglucosamine O-acyltransferase [Coralloluteibacterium stylophorae]
MIHPTAQIDPAAELGADVHVGAFSVIGANVRIGDGTHIGAHCVVLGPTRIGRDNRVHAFAAIGGDAQDKKFHGERAELVIGDRNHIREFVTINRGTEGGGGITRIGDDNWIQAYAHVAHDCCVGNHVIMSNNATIAGHVEVGDHAILSGFAGVHQFCRIGAHAFIGMGCLVNGDVPPFVMVADEYGRPRGINAEGLKRRGFDAERIGAIRRAYRTLYMSGLPRAEAMTALHAAAEDSDDVRGFVDFLATAGRPLAR